MQINASRFESWLRGHRQLAESSISQYLWAVDKFKEYPALDYASANHFLEKNKATFKHSFIRVLIMFYISNPDVAKEDGVDINVIAVMRFDKVRSHKPKKVKISLTPEQLKLVADRMKEEIHQIMFWLSYECGLRRAELLGITYHDLERPLKEWALNPNEPCKIKIMGKGRQEAYIFIPNYLTKQLYQWIAKQNSIPSFNIWGMKRSKWTKILRETSKEALGIDISPHTLRRSSMKNLLHDGKDIYEVKQFARHKNITTTMIYVGDDEEKARQIAIEKSIKTE